MHSVTVQLHGGDANHTCSRGLTWWVYWCHRPSSSSDGPSSRPWALESSGWIPPGCRRVLPLKWTGTCWRSGPPSCSSSAPLLAYWKRSIGVTHSLNMAHRLLCYLCNWPHDIIDRNLPSLVLSQESQAQKNTPDFRGKTDLYELLNTLFNVIHYVVSHYRLLHKPSYWLVIL